MKCTKIGHQITHDLVAYVVGLLQSLNINTPEFALSQLQEHKNLKMLSFCAVFNYSNCADREKGKSNYCFPSFVKNDGKGGLKLSKVKRE